MLKTSKLRACTTVLEANVAYPVDSNLLAKGIARMVKLANGLKESGLARRTKLADRTKRAHRDARQVVNTPRRRG